MSLFKTARQVSTTTFRAFSSTASVCANGKFEAKDLIINKTTSPKEKPARDKLVFGKFFSDHMMKASWSVGEGWKAPVIEQFGPLTISPGASVLHYALECFEGMKAFKGVDGKVRLFRPDRNAARFLKSSLRLTLPAFDTKEFLTVLDKLVSMEREWIPEGRGYSLYIRPTMIATNAGLGVGAATEALMMILCCPTGAYYSTGFKPVSLLADPSFARAWPGGMGDTKCGGNYAPTMKPQAYAAELGCQQVLWLFGQDEKVTEVGTMNLFMFWTNEQGEKELITAPLDGTILEGVTRQSILDLAREWGEFKVSEKYFNMAQLNRAVKEKRVHEMFGAGTAATVSPVATIKHRQGKDLVDLNIPLELGSSGALAKRFMDAIFDIQYGVTKNHPWAPIVN